MTRQGDKPDDATTRSPRRSVETVPAFVVTDGGGQSRTDEVVVEQPLEIRLASDPLTTTMRTPGEDHYLAVGFLFAEGVIQTLADVGTVSHCGRTDEPGYGHTLDVVPAGGAKLDWDRVEGARRAGLVSSACGVCGRASIDELLARVPPVPLDIRIPATLVARSPELLAAAQETFARTGGVHAAAALDRAGRIQAVAEDIGRHNAVDKVIGKLLYQSRLPRLNDPEAPILLVVSGRASFEMVQKAATAGFPLLASVSAASSLAIETAQTMGITLAAFVRPGRFTLYTHPDRVLPPAP